MGKVTNDERRRAAEALRWTLKAGSPYSIYKSVCFALGKTEHDGNWDVISRLADLIDPDTTGDTTTDTTKSKTTSLSPSLCERGVSVGYSEVTPKQGCPYWDGECMCRVTRRVVDVDALLELADEVHGLVENQEIRFFHAVQVHASTLATIETRIREALGERHE